MAFRERVIVKPEVVFRVVDLRGLVKVAALEARIENKHVLVVWHVLLLLEACDTLLVTKSWHVSEDDAVHLAVFSSEVLVGNLCIKIAFFGVVVDIVLGEEQMRVRSTVGVLTSRLKVTLDLAASE